MKKILYLGIVLMLGSCGEADSDEANESESVTSKVNMDGREVSTIKIGSLEILTEDLGKMTWEDAKRACADLGDGWRLPTKDELNIISENKEKIGGFADMYYWSSAEFDLSGVWTQGFPNGIQNGDYKNDYGYARAVRDF